MSKSHRCIPFMTGAFASLISIVSAHATPPSSDPDVTPRTTEVSRASAASELRESDAVALALENNPSLRSSAIEVRRAQRTVLVEQERWAPTLIAKAGFTRTQSPNLGSNGINTPLNNVYETSIELQKQLQTGTQLSLSLSGTRQTSTQYLFLSASQPMRLTLGPSYGVAAKASIVQPLLRGAGRDIGEADLRAARASRTSAERARDRAASELLRDVIQAYWELWYATESTKIERSSLELAQRQQAEAVAKVKLGAMADADALSFASTTATRYESLVTAEVDQKNRQVEMARLAGVADLVAAAADAPPMPPAPPHDLVERAEQVSVDVREQEAALDLAIVQAKIAGDARRPRLDLDGYVQAQGLGDQSVADAMSQLGTLGAVSVHVGLTFELPLERTRQQNEAAKAREAAESARFKLESTRQRVRADAVNAMSADASARVRVTLAEQTLAITEKQMNAEQARYATGGATSLAVLQAQNAWREAQLRVARAKADLIKTHALTRHLMGVLVDDHTSPIASEK